MKVTNKGERFPKGSQYKLLLLVLLFTSPFAAGNSNDDSAKTEHTAPPTVHQSMALTVDEALADFQLPPGYHFEPVLAEPTIEEPVLAVFDGNGNMYVAEMRTYMLDADGSDKFQPVSRVSMHVDTNGDGHYDRSTVFVDKMVLPRMILPLDDRIIIGETNTNDLYAYRDTDGDGVADEKKLWYAGGNRGGNLEHQPSGLIWALDNGIYTTYNDYRLRFTGGVVTKETIPVNNGQWGLTQDDWGKTWWVRAGAEIGPVHFQQHILYGQFHLDDERAPGYKTVWPIDNVPDTQGGRNLLRDDNTLNHFTATCGGDIFRGDRLPEDLRGDLIFAEPVGRLIRRTKINVNDGVTQISNAYPKSEFIRATDPLFRPVNMVTAPDGTLYFVDMYRGIIQESQWTPKGSYLREQIEELGMEKEVGRGRIYRLVHDDFEPGPQPHMLDETPSDWVEHLSHPNGWWRDTAQKLLVLKNDKSVVEALTALASDKDTDVKTRIHALWTLEGMGDLTPDLVIAALDNSNLEIVKTAIRLSEPYLKTNPELLTRTTALLNHPNPSVVIQSILSLKQGEAPDARALALATAEASDSIGVYAITDRAWTDETEDPYLLPMLGADGLKSYRSGRTFYNSVCFACHGNDGKSMVSAGRALAPPLAGSPRVLGNKDASIAIVLHGLQGLVDEVDYHAPMIPMSSYSDEELANVLTYIRNSFGNRSSAIQPADIKAGRTSPKPENGDWTMDSLETELPYLTESTDRFTRRNEWKFTAHTAPELVALALDDNTSTQYEIPRTAYAGHWITIELPATSTINSIIMDSGEDEEVYPQAYEIHVSTDGKDWGEPVFASAGEPIAQMNFEQSVSGKFIRITVTRKQGWRGWVISDLNIFGQEG